MPSIDTAVFQLSALALLGLILVVALIALGRIASLRRALNERPSATAADVVPFGEPESRPSAAEALEKPPGEADRGADAAGDEEAKAQAEPERLASEAAPEPGFEQVAEPEPVAERAEPERVEEPEQQQDRGAEEEAEPRPAPRGEAEPQQVWGAEPERVEGTQPVVEPVDRNGEESAEQTGAMAAQAPMTEDAGLEAEVLTAPSTVSAQQEQVAAGGREAGSQLSSERTWDEIGEQTQTPANGDGPGTEPSTGWIYDWAREMPEEQPVEREGRWWFKRGGELLLYDETTAQWVPAPVPESQGPESGSPADTAQFGGAAADFETEAQSSFWKCPSCGAVNGSTASTCRMCFAARP
jgi:hypothetical protein